LFAVESTDTDHFLVGVGGRVVSTKSTGSTLASGFSSDTWDFVEATAQDGQGPEYMVIPPEPYILTPDEVTVRPPLMVTPELIVAPLDAVTALVTVSVLWMMTGPAAVRPWIFVLPFPMTRLPLLTLMLPD
jgi:hypothetical protein